ncbi:MAG: lamin tail domain-containing protein [Candidatus Latescibacterota bacterium]|nr:MAG: lamin tail domain-containing protein [Candidatus Latescibacterota bacterium]
MDWERGTPRRNALTWPSRASLGSLFLLLALPLHASDSRAPLEIDLHLRDGRLDWEIRALHDVALVTVEWRSDPPGRLQPEPSLGSALQRGERRRGRVSFEPGTSPEWVDVQVHIRTAHAALVVGGSARLRRTSGRERLPVHVAPATQRKPAPGRIHARFLLQDRLLGPDGYTGEVQLLPLRHVDVELVDASGHIVTPARTDALGRVDLDATPLVGRSAFLRLRTSTRNHPRIDLAVLEQLREEGRDVLRAHTFETLDFTVASGGVALEDVILIDPDGFGRAQAFHILDVTLDAWDALASEAFLGAHPPDSLRLLWGPSMRIRSSAFGGSAIQVASPGSGDTDGWSDAVILHEIGHFVASRWLRTDSAGGIHLLGDVEQDLRLAYSEGLATAFACMVRAQRGSVRDNAAGRSIDLRAGWYIDSGMPPPDGIGGGLEVAWDVEAHRWFDGSQLPRIGTGSESNIAATLWDLADDASTPDAEEGDDDRAALGSARLWSLLEATRGLPDAAQITFESFWVGAAALLDETELETLRRLLVDDAAIEFAADAAEPDDRAEAAPGVVPASTRGAAGSVVIAEIDVGVTPAVEIANRGADRRDLGGWLLQARRNDTSTNPSLTYAFPDGFTLAPGARVVIHRGGDRSDDSARDLFAPRWTIPWFPETNGALILLDAGERAVDFVRWDGRKGGMSEVEVPAETLFNGRLAAPTFGHTLTRRADRADHNDATDFVAALPTLGAPNDTPTLHRTFYPVGDVDHVRVRAAQSGVHTFQILDALNGAQPRMTIRALAGARPAAQPRQTLQQPLSRLSLWLRAGEEVTLQLEHAGELTRFGVYELAVYSENDARTNLPPEGVRVVTAPSGGRRRISMSWWNAARYDSLRVRHEARPLVTLAGDATSWEGELAAGRHRLQLVSFVAGVEAAVPELLVAAEELPHHLTEQFETLAPQLWEATGTWSVTHVPGRLDAVLTDSPDGAYANRAESTVRLRGAVALGAEPRLCFEHVCIVRPEDSAVIEISSDWGGRWQRLGRWHQFQHGGGSDGADWSDGRADPEDWVHECISLSEFANETIQLRFRLQSDLHGAADGWYVDALRIESIAPPATSVRLGPIVPNPFNPSTRIEYALVQREHVSLRVFDVRGRLVQVLVDAPVDAGVRHATWDGRDRRGAAVASGVYYAHLRAGSAERSTKLVLLR